ncbi:MAG: hypothetical protein V1799_19700 [bacterium]
MVRIKIFVVLLALTMFASISQAQRSIEWKLPQYKITAPITLQGIADGDFVPVAMGKLDDLLPKSQSGRFGILFKEDSQRLGSVTVLELRDGASNALIKNVTLDEYFGKEIDSWKKIAKETKSSPTSLRSGFAVKTPGYDFILIREIGLKSDQNAPSGKKMFFNFSVQSKTPLNLNLKFMGKSTGVLKGDEKVITIASNDTTLRLNPVMVLKAEGGGHLQIQGASFNVSSTGKEIKANALVSALEFSIAATTVSTKEHVTTQANLMQAFAVSGKADPKIVVSLNASKEVIKGGDTVTYTLRYHNIGSAGASNITVSNPLPQGAKLIERSLENGGGEVKLIRAAAAPPAREPVKEIQWAFKSIINPGEERTVRYKVIF